MTYSYYRQSMDGKIYRRSEETGRWQLLDDGWRDLTVVLSEQDFDHLHEITAEAAERKGPSEVGR